MACAMVGGALPAEPPLTLLVAAERPQEVDAPERWPIHVAEVVLAVHALPEEEPAQPDLAARPDDQIGIFVAARVHVPADLLGGDARREVVRRHPGTEPRAH